MERDPREAAARERQAAMADELRKAELVRDRLEGLNQLVGHTRKATTCACCSRTSTWIELSKR